VLATAFKMFHSRDEKAECQKYQMLAQAMRGPGDGLTRGSQCLSAGHPLGSCYRCGGEGHWAKACPNPKLPAQPCPRCHAPGHWAIDCPDSRQGVGSVLHSSPDLIGLATDDGRGLGTPLPATTISFLEPKVSLLVDGCPICLLLDTGATFSVLTRVLGGHQLITKPYCWGRRTNYFSQKDPHAFLLLFGSSFCPPVSSHAPMSHPFTGKRYFDQISGLHLI
jgi:hypothetical protein